MRSAWIALVASCALLYGCATPWPQAVSVADPAFARRAQPIASVDVLPVDLQLWADDPSRGDPDALRASAETDLVSATTAALMQHGYAVRALIDWQGDYDAPGGGRALAYTPDALAATIDALSSYGSEASQHAGLPVPYLPAHLGDATHSDATLYVGGWSFVGDDTSNGTKVAEYVAIAVVIIIVVAIAIAASKSHGGGGHGGGGGGAHAAGGGHAGVSMGRFHGGGFHAPTAHVIGAIARTADAFGRIAAASADRPDWYDEAPHDGHSQMYVEMTLVDNHTGLVLWHARQQFPASAADHGDVQRVIASLVATLPAAP